MKRALLVLFLAVHAAWETALVISNADLPNGIISTAYKTPANGTVTMAEISGAAVEAGCGIARGNDKARPMTLPLLLALAGTTMGQL
jgi:hypothetical protein